MPKKVVSSKTPDVKVDIKTLSLGDLWVLFQIVNADLNVTTGKNASIKGIVSSRYSEVKNELYQRIYGCDPFAAQAVVVEGELPEKVLTSMSSGMVEDAKAQHNFVVSKPVLKEEE